MRGVSSEKALQDGVAGVVRYERVDRGEGSCVISCDGYICKEFRVGGEE